MRGYHVRFIPADQSGSRKRACALHSAVTRAVGCAVALANATKPNVVTIEALGNGQTVMSLQAIGGFGHIYLK